MNFEVFNTTTRVSSLTATEDAWLRHVLSHSKAVKGYMGITKGYQDLSFYDSPTRSFPSGLLPLVSDMAREAGHEIFFEDMRVKPCLPSEVDIPFLQDELRGKYQSDAIEAGVAWGRGIWWCPTGFGKTQLAIGIAKRLPCRWAFIVDEASLLDQTIDRWNVWDLDNEPAGILGAGRWQDARFVVATYQTLMAKINDPTVQRWVESIGGLLLDETHVVAAPEYYKTAMRFHNAYWRIGLSATPLSRGPWENLHVMAVTGRVIYRAEIPEMVNAGVLAMPVVEMVPFEHKEASAATWQGVYGELVVRNLRRNSEVVNRATTGELPCFVFVKQINHGDDLLAKILKKGMRAEFLWAEATLRERKAAMKRMVDGELDIIVTNRIFQKGIDVPNLRSIVIAAGGRSVVDALQRVGRGMRVVPGKRAFTVVDFMDKGNDWLLRHSRERRIAYKNAGYLLEEAGAQQGLFTT